MQTFININDLSSQKILEKNIENLLRCKKQDIFKFFKERKDEKYLWFLLKDFDSYKFLRKENKEILFKNLENLDLNLLKEIGLKDMEKDNNKGYECGYCFEIFKNDYELDFKKEEKQEEKKEFTGFNFKKIYENMTKKIDKEWLIKKFDILISELQK